MRRLFLILLILAPTNIYAQHESALHADFRQERKRFKKSCPKFSFKAVPGCLEFLVTDHPLHFTGGSIAPQNGFGAGLAFAFQKNYGETLRTSWDADAVASPNGSWRAGFYFKGVPVSSSQTTTRVFPIFNAYVQAISLNKLTFFGLGPSSSLSGRSFYGMTQTIPGGNAILPIYNRIGLSLYGEMNGRFVSIRGDRGESSPSIEQLYTAATAPGLQNQPGFLQFGEGARLRHPFYTDHVQLDYLVTFQQFLAPGNSVYSFRRFTVDLSHQFPIYGQSPVPVGSSQGPNECTENLQDDCPKMEFTRDFAGSFGIRLLISESIAPAGHIVPFYFQPTLGGSDINGSASLASFQDYRFRAPNVLLLRGSFEHSIYGPLGFSFIVDEGKVALTRGDVGFSTLAHSFSTGLTLRAGGFPQVYLLFSWGGKEGTHTIANVNTSLLGGSARPSLY